jgi:hypothetical protein
VEILETIDKTSHILINLTEGKIHVPPDSSKGALLKNTAFLFLIYSVYLIYFQLDT